MLTLMRLRRCTECGAHLASLDGPGRPRMTCDDDCYRARQARRKRLPDYVTECGAGACGLCRASSTTRYRVAGGAAFCRLCVVAGAL